MPPCSRIRARCCSTRSSAAAISTSSNCSPRREQVESEIRAHRGRLVALVEAALDAAQAEALAARLQAAGADEAGSAPLRNGAELIGHVVEARFP